MTHDLGGQFVPFSALDAIQPMHMLVGEEGTVRHVAPTLAKISPEENLIGKAFFDLFAVERPRTLASGPSLTDLVGKRLRLRFMEASSLKAKVLPLGKGDGYFIDLSFGISVISAVAEHSLTNADFASNDPTVEMLYLAEANAAAMHEARRLVARLQSARDTAQDASLTDGLTGLKNRRALEAEVAERVRQNQIFSLLQIDLDYFKAVNDTHGHAAGDAVLQATSDRLQNQLRSGDFASRIGGDEFVIIVSEVADGEGLVKIATRLIRQIEEPVNHDGIECRISASIGIARSIAYRDPSLDQMMADADRALYAAKGDGRGRAILVNETIPDMASGPSQAPARSAR
ncbi:MAG: GGDEF domain-containing protein [Pseudomonadota bacterium]